MHDLVRDTAFGHLVRLFSRKKLLKYPDENYSALWKQSLQSRRTAPSAAVEKESNFSGDIAK